MDQLHNQEEAAQGGEAVPNSKPRNSWIDPHSCRVAYSKHAEENCSASNPIAAKKIGNKHNVSNLLVIWQGLEKLAETGKKAWCLRIEYMPNESRWLWDMYFR